MDKMDNKNGSIAMQTLTWPLVTDLLATERVSSRREGRWMLVKLCINHQEKRVKKRGRGDETELNRHPTFQLSERRKPSVSA